MVSKLKDRLNFYDNFKFLYFQILDDFKFNFKKDCEARDILDNILSKKDINWNLENILKSIYKKILSKSNIMIYGCGPSLEKTVNIVLQKKGAKFFSNFINFAANGASVFLREKNIPVDFVFTDLDGITEKEFNYANFVVVHAHGDNIQKIRDFEEVILKHKNIIGTTQTEETDNVINPGGFTDGDRILYFLHSLLTQKHKLFLIGMDFETIIGKYSKLEMKKDQKANPIKKKKLRYALKLIEWIQAKIQNDIYYVNSNIKSQKLIYLSIEEFIDISKQNI